MTSNEMTSNENLAQALRDTYTDRAGCPPPEAYLADAALTEAQRRELEAHAERCPACAGERALARSFDAEPRAEELADIAAVTEVLRAARAQHPDVATRAAVLSHPRWGQRLSRTLLPLAAAASLLLGVAVLTRLPGQSPPVLPDRPATQVMRGATIQVEFPRGRLASMPEQLSWARVPGAASYRVSLIAVDEAVLWEETLAHHQATLPRELSASLHAAVRYRWRVEAYDANHTRLAWSDTIEFQVDPSAR